MYIAAMLAKGQTIVTRAMRTYRIASDVKLDSPKLTVQRVDANGRVSGSFFRIPIADIMFRIGGVAGMEYAPKGWVDPEMALIGMERHEPTCTSSPERPGVAAVVEATQVEVSRPKFTLAKPTVRANRPTLF